MQDCTICNHPHREYIENALFKMTPETSEEILSKIAEKFDVTVDELQEHALFHTSCLSGAGTDSIVRLIKMREADMLAAVAMDQMNTLKMVGGRIRKLADVTDVEDIRFERSLTKPVVDLYVGAGDGVRRTVQTLADINKLLNGPEENANSGLVALAEAIKSSGDQK